MHPDIFTLGTCLFIVLLCLTTDAPLTVKHIFEDNLNWAAFRLAEKDNLRDVEITKVNKWAPKCTNCGRKTTLVNRKVWKCEPCLGPVDHWLDYYSRWSPFGIDQTRRTYWLPIPLHRQDLRIPALHLQLVVRIAYRSTTDVNRPNVGK